MEISSVGEVAIGYLKAVRREKGMGREEWRKEKGTEREVVR